MERHRGERRQRGLSCNNHVLIDKYERFERRESREVQARGGN